MSVALFQRPLISARTTSAKKQRFAALAASRGMTESRLLMLLVDTVLERNPTKDIERRADGPSERVTLRLRPGDLARVAERAAARDMKPASYMVALIHAHVSSVAPLPARELNTLEVAVNQLASVSRQVQQLAQSRCLSDCNGSLQTCLRDTLQHVEVLRRDTAEVVRTNLLSWEAGDA